MAVWRPKISVVPISIQHCARDRTESDIEETSGQRDATGTRSPKSGGQRNTVTCYEGSRGAVDSDMYIGGDSDFKTPELPSKIPKSDRNQHPTYDSVTYELMQA